MAGIYIHIPFCKQKCHYCSFHFSTTYHQYEEEMLTKMAAEMELKSKWLKQKVETIYFGGGTPSLLSAEQIRMLIARIYQCYTVDDQVEITLEANPDDINSEGLSDWKKAGINRLSIGVQSFFNEDLKRMNRAHNSKEALDAVPLARAAGFANISIDLMFALPFQTAQDWEKNLDQAIALEVDHISCYNLTVEEKTALKHKIEKQQWPNVDEDTSAELFEITKMRLAKAEIHQYEISNYAKKGKRSKHNTAYWYQKPFIGIGPSAHSYIDGLRFSNVSNNQIYMQSIDKGKPPKMEKETLGDVDLFNEYVLTRLRLNEGIPLADVLSKFPNQWSRVQVIIERYIMEEKLWSNEKYLGLTSAGQLIADEIAADLFVLD